MTTDRILMKQEALKRMKVLQLRPDVISKFERRDAIRESFLGTISCPLYDVVKRIKEFEEESGGLVYHVIENYYEDIGHLLSFLFVSKYDEEWEQDMDDLNYMTPLVYVANVTDENCSEYGSIKIKSYDGGLIRVY